MSGKYDTGLTDEQQKMLDAEPSAAKKQQLKEQFLSQNEREPETFAAMKAQQKLVNKRQEEKDNKKREERKNMTAEERLHDAEKTETQENLDWEDTVTIRDAEAQGKDVSEIQGDAIPMSELGFKAYNASKNYTADGLIKGMLDEGMSREDIEASLERRGFKDPKGNIAAALDKYFPQSNGADDLLDKPAPAPEPAPKVEETKEPEAPAASATQEEVDNAEKELGDKGIDPSSKESLVRAVEKSGLGELVMTKDGTYVFKPHFMTRDEWAEETGNSSGRFWDWLTVGSMAITCLTAYLSDGAFAVPPFNFRAMDRDKQSYDAYLGNVQNLASDFNSVLTSAYSETAESKIEEEEDNKSKLDSHATAEGKREAEKAKYTKDQELAYQKALGKYQKDLEITLQDALADIDVDKDARLGDNEVDTVKKTLQAKLEDEYKRLNKVSELTHDEKNAISWLVDAKSGLSTMAEQEQVENAHKSVGNIVNGAAEIVDAIMPF